jgi:ribosomal protein L37AE/L43A
VIPIGALGMSDEEVKVIPRKNTFRDVRMDNVVCPLCSDGVRIVKMEEHAFGELGFWQCDSCGCIIDICNMVNRPTEYTEIINDFKSCTHASIRSFLK